MEKAEICRKDAEYSAGKSMMRDGYVNAYESAIRHFKKIPGWKDADALIAECENTIAELKAQKLERERKAEIERKAAEKRAKKKKQRNLKSAKTNGKTELKTRANLLLEKKKSQILLLSGPRFP